MLDGKHKNKIGLVWKVRKRLFKGILYSTLKYVYISINEQSSKVW